MKENEKNYISSLTGIRAIAAFMVFVHHYLGTSCDGKNWCPVVLELHTGVSIFFVLSGFLITHKYYRSSSLNINWLKNYYLSRFARIYPLFFITTAATLLILKSNITEWFLSITFLKGFFDSYKFIVISQTWTLTVEVVFYFLAPFIFILNKKGLSLILMLISVFLLGVLISSGGHIGDLRIFLSSHLFMLIYTFLGRCFEFFTGIYLALFTLNMNKSLIKKGYTYFGLGAVVAVIITISSFQSDNYRYGVFSPEGILIHNFILPLAIALFFLGLIFENTIISSFLSSSLMQILGKSSYAFYLIHLGILPNLLPDFLRANMLIFFITVIIISVTMYIFLERPLNTIIKKYQSSTPNQRLKDNKILL